MSNPLSLHLNAVLAHDLFHHFVCMVLVQRIRIVYNEMDMKAVEHTVVVCRAIVPEETGGSFVAESLQDVGDIFLLLSERIKDGLGSGELQCWMINDSILTHKIFRVGVFSKRVTLTAHFWISILRINQIDTILNEIRLYQI